MRTCVPLTSTRYSPWYINILVDTFLLKVLGWCTPGIPGGPTSTPPSCITCGTVQLFFHVLLRLFCSCCQLFLDFSAASCKFVFSANQYDFELFRDFFFLFV